jgi:hypothetical protein
VIPTALAAKQTAVVAETRQCFTEILRPVFGHTKFHITFSGVHSVPLGFAQVRPRQRRSLGFVALKRLIFCNQKLSILLENLGNEFCRELKKFICKGNLLYVTITYITRLRRQRRGLQVSVLAENT